MLDPAPGLGHCRLPTGVFVTDANYPIVGIGASAGGVEALEHLFDHMPADTGCAFVVVTHLTPDRRGACCRKSCHAAQPCPSISRPRAKRCSPTMSMCCRPMRSWESRIAN